MTREANAAALASPTYPAVADRRISNGNIASAAEKATLPA